MSGALLRRLLAAEGPAAVRDRLLDRLAGWRRRRGFEDVETHRPPLAEAPVLEPRVPVLDVLPVPPRPDFGGVQVQLLLRLEATATLRPWALLYPEADGYRLEVDTGSRRLAVGYRVPVGLDPVALHDGGFAAVVRHAARRVGAETIHFEQLAGLPLATVAELGREGWRTVVSVHDFGLFCPRPHLIEQPASAFCDFCRDRERCGRCLRSDWPVADGYQEERRRLSAEILASAAAVIYPSPYLRRTYGGLFPHLDEARQVVVAPPAIAVPRVCATPHRRQVRHIAYVGSVQPHKGARLFEALLDALPPDRLPGVRWSVFGGGDPELLRRLRRRPAVHVRGYYRAGSLPALLRARRVDLALLLSIWPEAYGLTLDECLLAGVPALTFDRGAMGERARQAGCDPLDPAAGLAGLEARIRALCTGPSDAGEPHPGPPGVPVADAGEAARAHERIYTALLTAHSTSP